MSELAVRRLIEGFNSNDLDVVDDVCTPDMLDHAAAPNQAPGRDGYKRSLSKLRRGFPDARMTIDDLIVAGDRVVVRWTIQGTHDGRFVGLDPTGRKVKVHGITIDRCEDGRIAEEWASWDMLSLFQQLGFPANR